MKSNTIKKPKKLIAKVYKETEQEKLKQRHLLLLLGVLGVMVLSLHSFSAHAAPATVNLEVTNGQINVDYAQVDNFTSAQDAKTVKYAAIDGDQLILSEKPIDIRHAYQPRSLTDLGVRINSAEMAEDKIVRIPTYNLVRNEIHAAPSIPDMIVMAEQGTTTAVNEATSAPGVSTEALAPATPVAAPAQPITSSYMASDDLMFWEIFGGSALVLTMLLLATRARRYNRENSTNIYKGQAQSHTMVGKGKLFDFNGNVLNGKVTPINTTFLNMLWHVGKFSKEGSMNTYFYMAFYIPPQQDYAKSLQQEDEKKQTHKES